MNYRGLTILLVVQDFATICNHPQYVGMGENPSKPTITIYVSINGWFICVYGFGVVTGLLKIDVFEGVAQGH